MRIVAEIYGTDGDELLRGTEGDDIVRALKGDDSIDVSLGRDRIRGGQGWDQLVLDMGVVPAVRGSRSVTVGADFLRDASGAIHTTFGRVEYLYAQMTANGDTLDAGGFAGIGGNLFGGVGDDRITGTAGADRIESGGGNDRLSGGAGDDQIYAFQLGGSHRFDGGEGRDTTWIYLDAEQRPQVSRTVLEDVRGGFAATTNGVTSTYLRFEDVTIGFDLLDRDTRYGVIVENNSRVGVTMLGTERADVLRGGSGNDDLGGWFGHDLLSGGDGNDQISAAAGRDVVEGGRGNDAISGGYDGELDVFVFGENSGRDTLGFFEVDHDRIRIEVAGVTGFDQLQVTGKDRGSLISFGDASIHILNAAPGEIHAGLFEFAVPPAGLGTDREALLAATLTGVQLV